MVLRCPGGARWYDDNTFNSGTGAGIYFYSTDVAPFDYTMRNVIVRRNVIVSYGTTAYVNYLAGGAGMNLDWSQDTEQHITIEDSI